jgi:hypothetical protein
MPRTSSLETVGTGPRQVCSVAANALAYPEDPVGAATPPTVEATSGPPIPFGETGGRLVADLLDHIRRSAPP